MKASRKVKRKLEQVQDEDKIYIHGGRNSGKSTMQAEEFRKLVEGKTLKDESVKFRVDSEFTIGGQTHKVEESEASWYMIDQQGNFYSHSPMKLPTPCTKEDSLVFKLKIGNEYLTVGEIEKRLGV